MNIEVETKETVVVTSVVITLNHKEIKHIRSMVNAALFMKEGNESAHTSHVLIKNILLNKIDEALEGF